MSRLRRRLFGLSEDEVTFARRGFRGGDDAVRSHLERVGSSFLAGYHAALELDREHLVARLNEIAAVYRGFAFEGAAMSLTMLDILTPWRRQRWRTFLEDGAGAHVYMAHVGAGWAIARLPFGMRATLARLDPLLRWLAFDGYGFHQGYFHWPRSIAGRQEVPRRVTGYGRRAFDHGLGRSLWFVEGAEVERIPATIGTFPASRQPDLWAGVGLASTYAGGVARESLEALLEAAGEHRDHFTQGMTFAAEARQRAGNPTPHTELACRVFGGISAAEAAGLTASTRQDLPPDGDLPAYEHWRQRIRSRMAREISEPGKEEIVEGVSSV